MARTCLRKGKGIRQLAILISPRLCLVNTFFFYPFMFSLNTDKKSYLSVKNFKEWKSKCRPLPSKSCFIDFTSNSFYIFIYAFTKIHIVIMYMHIYSYIYSVIHMGTMHSAFVLTVSQLPFYVSTIIATSLMSSYLGVHQTHLFH